MSRYDAAIDALSVMMLVEFKIILGPNTIISIRSFIPEFEFVSDNNEFCELFWGAAKIAVNRILETAGKETIEEDGNVMHQLYLHWREVWLSKMD